MGKVLSSNFGSSVVCWKDVCTKLVVSLCLVDWCLPFLVNARVTSRVLGDVFSKDVVGVHINVAVLLLFFVSTVIIEVWFFYRIVTLVNCYNQS